jgi:hypothetical protein
LFVVIAFQDGKLAREVFVRGEDFAQTDEGTHYFDVDLRSPRAAEYRREHGDPPAP